MGVNNVDILSNSFNNNTVIIKCEHNEEEKIYDYEDALNITGNGWYNHGLLLTLSIALLGMGIDMFGFSIIITGCSCDFQLEIWQKSIMLSMPFIGPIVMSIAWGYISDTQGRRRTLLIALWGSFFFSFISAFSTNWVMLSALKVFSSMFCSAVQSIAYSLLGESCTSKVRGFYMLVLTSALMMFVMSYVVSGYFILQLNFSLSLSFITFTAWRLLIIVLALPLLSSAIMLHFYYESPKFLIIDGQQHQALENLKKIYVKNGGCGKYPVRRVVVQDDSKARDKTIHILNSLWQQTMPLFKPPLLGKTLQLFFLTVVIYGINNCWIMWLPTIVEALHEMALGPGDGLTSLCSIISNISTRNTTGTEDSITCSTSIQSSTLLSGIIHGVVFTSINLAVSKLASRKKILMIIFFLIAILSTLGAVYNQNYVASLLLFVGMLMTSLCMGIVFVYYVEMYPTSYSGMAASLGVMVARLSGVAGVNFLGSYVMTHCVTTFYASAVILFSGIVVAVFCLPSDTSE